MLRRILSHYRILEEVGAGGMGVVYRARDERLHRDVAVKILPPGLLADEAARKRFRKEALALSQLNHPHVATVHDFDSQGGVDFLVMEMIEGKPLSEYLAGGPLPERDIVRLGDQLLQGLAAAHGSGVIHRDLKPGNIRITTDGRLKILDFGLALLTRPLIDASTTATAPDWRGAGTLPYMAPELLRGHAPDARSDIYAAGAVLYEMACGRRAFAQPSAHELFGAILHEEPPAPRTQNTRVSPGLEHVIVKAMEKDPARRYQSAGELAAALDGIGGTVAIQETALSRRTVRVAVSFLTLGAIVILVALIARSTFVTREAYSSIAVLPFANMTSDTNLNYVSDGITDGLINTLSTVPTVEKVTSRASVFEFKGKSVDPKRLGRLLGVRCLLIGRVVRAPGGFLVSAELVDTKDGRHIWGRKYSRADADLSSLEGELCTDVSAGLRLSLHKDDRKRVSARSTSNLEAYDSYLKGRYQLNEHSLRKALDYFETAVAADPGYALAYVGMSECYSQMASQVIPTEEAYPKVRAAAQRALQLDSELGEAHAALATVRGFHDWMWDEAETEFRRAIALNPNYAMARVSYGLMLTCLGRSEEALTQLRRARDLDPLSPAIAEYATWPLQAAPRRARRLGEVIRELESLRDAYPKLDMITPGLISAYVATGRISDAVAEADRAAAIQDSAATPGIKGYAYGIAGRRAEARRFLAAVERHLAQDPSAYNTAVTIRIGLGQREEALDAAERAVAVRNEDMLLVGVLPVYDPLRSSPRFRQLLARMNLPQSLAEE